MKFTILEECKKGKHMECTEFIETELNKLILGVKACVCICHDKGE